MLQSIQSEESHLPAHREINLRVPIELITIIFNMARANDKPKYNTNIRICQVWHRYLSGDHQVAQKMLPACRKGKSKSFLLSSRRGAYHTADYYSTVLYTVLFLKRIPAACSIIVFPSPVSPVLRKRRPPHSAQCDGLSAAPAERVQTARSVVIV